MRPSTTKPCDEYDLFLECFAGAKEHQALIRLGFEKVKTPKENDEETLVEAECEVQEAIVERAPPEKRDMLARKIKDRLRMLDAEADGDEAGDAAFAAYMARERHEADAKLKSLQEAWRKESNAKDRSTNRRVAELKAENDRLRRLVFCHSSEGAADGQGSGEGQGGAGRVGAAPGAPRLGLRSA